MALVGPRRARFPRPSGCRAIVRRTPQRSSQSRPHSLCDCDVQLLVGSARAAPLRRGPGGSDCSMTAKVSVILPVHNRADVLARAIESVLDQEFRDLELIVIDDGSTDNSKQIAQSFGDERVQLIQLGENRGGNVARNEGIRASTAPLIAFLD